jgi:ATP-dependent helicase HrpA
MHRLAGLDIRFPEDLPVVRARAEIQAALSAGQVVVVCGETGSGKTTQLPKICLAAGRGTSGMITVTQPRRIAARSVAARIAEELGTAVGDAVGFKVRFDDRTSGDSLVRLVTDGVLLAEIERDPLLRRSDTIIVDEAHERSLNIDFLLGCLRRILPRRPELKVIVSSATIDAGRFSAHFGGAPVVAVDGRLHPIETRWRPPADGEEDLGPAELVARGVEECVSAGPGDILAFLGGERDIHDAAELLSRMPSVRGCEILPLYSRLPAAEQDRVFRPGGSRRIVLATNVAETSVTVPGIRFVVDSGVARMARWSGRARVLRLPVEPVSRASADQRRGRCGRVGPGTCVRLYSQEDYLAREPFTAPEVLRTNLASVILQMKALRLGPIEDFPFIDPPSPRLVAEGLETLRELGAIDQRGRLTETGRRMSRLPVDPRLSRLLLESVRHGVAAEGLVLAAGLSVPDPRERPAGQAGAADLAHAEFRHPEGDFLSMLRLWRRWREEAGRLGSSALRRWCRQRFLSHQRLREWTELHGQLRSMAEERLRLRTRPPSDDVDPARVHRAVLAGFVTQAAFRTDEGDYRTASGTRFSIFPGSAIAGRAPHWLVAAEVFETSRRFGRVAARIRGDWIEQVAPHLVERIRSEPHWVRATGQVAAWERVRFGELTVVARRRVPWGPEDPVGARDLFIQAALVDGDCDLDAPFVRHNRQLRDRIEAMEAKRRGRGLLVDAEARFAFFDARVPASVHSLPAFERWRREAERGDPRVLFMEERDLLAQQPEPGMEERFPDRLALGPGTTADLRYEHAPGSAGDGVHARVALADLAGADLERLEWLVPGLLADKVEALARSLPKGLRVRLFPLREVAEEVAAGLHFGEGPLLEAVAARLSAIAGAAVAPGDFDLRSLPPHLRMHVEVVDDAGAVVARGDDAAAVRAQAAPLAEARRRSLASRAFGADWEREGLRDFDLDVLPERVESTVDGVRVVGWPALEDRGTSVALTVAPDAESADRRTRLGMRRLAAIAAADALRHHAEFAAGFESLTLDWAASTGTEGARLRDALALLVAGRAFVDGRALPRTPAEFARRLDEGAAALPATAAEAVRALSTLHRRSLEVLEALEGKVPPSWAASVADIRRERARLASPALLERAGWGDLDRLARAMAALAVRARRLGSGGLARDAEAMRAIAPWEAEVARAEVALAASGRDPAELDAFRALLEEYRVSLFAQELRTPVRVSAERLERAWRTRRA